MNNSSKNSLPSEKSSKKSILNTQSQTTKALEMTNSSKIEKTKSMKSVISQKNEYVKNEQIKTTTSNLIKNNKNLDKSQSSIFSIQETKNSVKKPIKSFDNKIIFQKAFQKIELLKTKNSFKCSQIFFSNFLSIFKSKKSKYCFSFNKKISQIILKNQQKYFLDFFLFSRIFETKGFLKLINLFREKQNYFNSKFFEKLIFFKETKSVNCTNSLMLHDFEQISNLQSESRIKKSTINVQILKSFSLLKPVDRENMSSFDSLNFQIVSQLENEINLLTREK